MSEQKYYPVQDRKVKYVIVCKDHQKSYEFARHHQLDPCMTWFDDDHSKIANMKANNAKCGIRVEVIDLDKEVEQCLVQEKVAI